MKSTEAAGRPKLANKSHPAAAVIAAVLLDRIDYRDGKIVGSNAAESLSPLEHS
jgi:hypothetical protein